MLGDLSGPTLIVLFGLIVIVLIGVTIGLIVWAIIRANRTKQADLQRAYEAGLNQPRE